MAITRLVVMLCSYAMVAHAVVSQTPQSPPEQVETVRINTQLVQTDVMVFDKQGKFVPGLRPQDFEPTRHRHHSQTFAGYH